MQQEISIYKNPEQRTKSLIKWAGGKGRVLKDLEPIFKKINIFDKDFGYYEPFCGSCTVALALGGGKQYLNDKNEKLINFFNQVKLNPKDLLDSINQEVKNYNSSLSMSSCYYELRERYNHLDIRGNEIEHAGLFWILNHTGFNGMYRETKRGEFNIPHGKRRCPDLNPVDLFEVSEKIKDAVFSHDNFDIFCNRIQNEKEWDSLVYLDPPYIPASNTASFRSYLKEGFGLESHYKLKEIMIKLSESKKYVIMSNSNTEETRNIYGNIDGFSFKEIEVSRSISGGRVGRGKVGELIITNIS